MEEHLLSRMVDSSMVFDYNTRSAQNPGKEVEVHGSDDGASMLEVSLLPTAYFTR